MNIGNFKKKIPPHNFFYQIGHYFLHNITVFPGKNEFVLLTTENPSI